MPEWSVELHPECEAWAHSLEQGDAEALLAAIRILRDLGPALGRPLVDTVTASRHRNMKELRPGSTGRTEIRVLFAFDVRRRAILLCGGDKAGNWRRWYAINIPIAEDRFHEHQVRISGAADDSKRDQQTGRKRKQR